MTMFFSQINVRTGEASYKKKKKNCNIHVINVNVDKPKMEVVI